MLNTLAPQHLFFRGLEQYQNQRSEDHQRRNVNVTGTWESIVAWGENAKLDTEQQTAFEILASTYVLTFYEEATNDVGENNEEFSERIKCLKQLARRSLNPTKPLRLFVTGPAGAGKCKFLLNLFQKFKTNLFSAKLLEELITYAKLFSQKINHDFDGKSIRLTAMTGTAATEIGGKTAASEFHYMKNKDFACDDEITDFSDTRINIIDEISFADYENVLEKISHNLQRFSECQEHIYGNQAMCFLGDFCQLECIGGNSIYKNRRGIFWEQSLTHMVELKGTHRYNRCSIMQQIMPKVRENGLSNEDREILNSRVIDGLTLKIPNPKKTRFATFSNEKRCAINAHVFKHNLIQNHSECTESNICTSSIVIKAHAEWPQRNIPLSFGQRKLLFEECPEAKIKNTQSQRCDPFLCLFDGCNVMVNENVDVENGIANGTTCIFKKAKLKPGAILYPIKMHGYWVNSVSVDDVEHLQLQWQDSSRFIGTFKIRPQKATYKVLYPIVLLEKKIRTKTSICLTQFPIVINHATTGHKLQGKSLNKLVIAQWSRQKNWAYVVISRVRTLSGLYLTKKIPVDIDFTPAQDYLDMMKELRENILVKEHDDVTLLKTTLDYRGLFL